MTDDFRARLRQAWTEEHGHAPTWVEEMLIDTYAEHMDAAMGRIFGDVVDWKPLGLLGVDVAPWLAAELDIQGVSPIRAALERARPHSTPPIALRGRSSSVPPNGTPTEEERTPADRARAARDVVRQADAPILAAAAAQLLGGFEPWEPDGANAGSEPTTGGKRVARELVPLVRAAANEVPLPRPHSRTLPCWCDAVDWAGVTVHNDYRVDQSCVAEMPDGWFRP